MSAIDDLIAQVEDATLRQRLRSEAKRLTKEKKFGLVFEDHLPEVTPLYDAKVAKGCKVAIRDSALTDLWRVMSLSKDSLRAKNLGTGDVKEFPTQDVVVVRQFGEPIFPCLVEIDHVENGEANAPWHALIEADNYHALQLLEYTHAGEIDCIYIDPPYNSGARDWKYNTLIRGRERQLAPQQVACIYAAQTAPWRHGS